MNTRKTFAILGALLTAGIGIVTLAGQSAEAAIAMN
jgi:hypothetical protein